MIPKQREELIAFAQERGWKREMTLGGHIKMTSPKGKVVFHSSTPSDVRANMNFRAQLIRAGLRDEPVSRPTIALPPPRMVVDRNPGAVTERRPVVTKKPKRQHGELKTVFLDAIRRIDPTGTRGATTDEIWPRIGAALPDFPREQLGPILANYCNSGALVRMDRGRYRIPRPDAPAPAAPVMPVQINPDMSEDFKILDRVLQGLTELEGVIRKHQTIAQQLAGISGMLAMFQQVKKPEGDDGVHS